MVVAIVGMLRSGTSLVSRLINLAGVYLGEESDLKEAAGDNPKGFWEHLQFMRINDALLAHFGAGYWNFPPVFPEQWQEAESLSSLRQEARALVETFSGRALWGWKDPRTSLTLPFWRQVLADLGLAGEFRVVLCVRNPLDVAASISANGPIPTEQSLALWHHYTEQVLLDTRPEERVVVFYEDVLRDFRAALAPVLRCLDLPPLPEQGVRARAFQEFVDRDLRHHQHTLEEFLSSDVVPEYTKQFYQALLSGPEAVGAFLAEPSRAAHEASRLHQFHFEFLKLPETQALPEPAQILQASQQRRIEVLEAELGRLETILNSPPHRAVHLMSGKIRRVPILHKVTTALLQAAMGHRTQKNPPS